MPITKKKKVKKDPEYMNVRISYKTYEVLREFCKGKRYKIGGFIEDAAFNRMTHEINNSHNFISTQ